MGDSVSVATEAGAWPPKKESDRSRNERFRSRDGNSFFVCLLSSLCLRNDDLNESDAGRCGRAAEERSEGNQEYTGLGLVVRDTILLPALAHQWLLYGKGHHARFNDDPSAFESASMEITRRGKQSRKFMRTQLLSGYSDNFSGQQHIATRILIDTRFRSLVG